MQTGSYQKALVNAKGSIALGLAMIFFGINQLVIHPTTTIIIISGVLIIVGGYFVYQSVKIYRYFSRVAAKEKEEPADKK